MNSRSGPGSGGDPFFLKPDRPVVPSLQATSQWANSGNYDPAAASTFLQVADFYLVAHAHAHGHVVVTHEVVAQYRRVYDLGGALGQLLDAVLVSRVPASREYWIWIWPTFRDRN